MNSDRSIDTAVHSRRPSRPSVAYALVAGLLALGLLGGCLAEEGTGTSSASAVGGTWSDVAAIFWTGSCAGCHPPVGGGPGVTVLDYNSLINDNTGTCGGAPNMVTPGNRATSCLYLSVTGTGGNSMAAYLSVDQQEEIGTWIDNGAPGP